MERATQTKNDRMLVESARDGDLETIKSLVELKGVNINHADENKWNALHHAACKGYSDILKYLISKGANIEAKDKEGATPLFRASKFGKVETAKALVRLGAKTNVVNKKGENLLDAVMLRYDCDVESMHFFMGLDLHIPRNQYGKLFLWSAKKGDLELLKPLLWFKKVDPNYVDKDKWSALHWAAHGGQSATIEYLIHQGLNIEATDNEGNTPLFIALRFNKVEAAKALVQLGAKTDVVNTIGDNLLGAIMLGHCVESMHFVLKLDFLILAHQYGDLLIWSITRGDLDLIKKVVQFEEVNLNYVDDRQWTALHWAARVRQPEIIVYLKSMGANIEAMNKDGETPLFTALEVGKVENAKTLVRLGAKTDVKNNRGQNLLDYVMLGCDVVSMNFVIELNLQIPEDQYGKLVLWSAKKGDLELLKPLLWFKKSIDLNYMDEDGQTALHWAAHGGCSDIVEHLIANGANMEAVNQAGETPLFTAVKFNQVETANALIRFGAKTDVVNKKGENLLNAASSPALRTVKTHSVLPYLKESIHLVLGFDLQISADQYGELLLSGAKWGDSELIKLLIELKNIDINYLDTSNRSALYWAAHEGHTDIVEYLIQKGANVETIDRAGETPLFAAVKFNQVETSKCLLRSGAKTDVANNKGENLLDAMILAHELDLIHYVIELDRHMFADRYEKLLLSSAKWGDLDLIKKVVDFEKVNLNCVDQEDWTALHWATHVRQPEIVNYLVLKGANMEAQNRDGETPLFTAVKFNQVEVARALIRAGAKTDVVNNKGENLLDAALFYAFQKSRAQSVLPYKKRISTFCLETWP